MAKAFIDDTNLTNIGNAIRSQNGTTTTYLPSEMADAINALPVLDTSDGTATSGDIANGKIAYVDGEQVTGSLPDYEKPVDINDATYSEKYCLHKNFTSNIEQASFQIGNTSVSAIKLSSEATADAIIRNGQTYCHIASAGWFGDAKAADVAAGKTFTSSAGLKITGTSSNFVKATGTTTSETIDTGLSSIEFFEIHYVSSTSVTNGLVQGAYYGNNDTLFFTYANGSSTIFTNTSLPSVSGGTINLNLSSNNSNWALSNKALHYYWTAFGQA